MKVLKIILYTLLALTAFVVLLGLFARKNYHVERSIEIEAPLEKVYEQVRFFKNAPNWSPWLYLDPHVKTEIKGNDGEVGALYTWEGNDKIGKGYQRITAVSPRRIDLEVMISELGASPVFFAFEEKEESTKVTWVMDMHVPFPWNAFSMFTDMNNGFIGKDFENGLAHLKRYCEPKKYRGYVVNETKFPTSYYATIRQVVDFPNIGKFLEEGFPQVIEASEKAGAKMMGTPSGFYWTFDTTALKTDMAAAILLDKQVKIPSPLELVALGGDALVIEYTGDYAKSSEAHGAMEEYIAEKKLQYTPPVIEEYLTDQEKEPDTAKWQMRIIYFVGTKTEEQKR